MAAGDRLGDKLGPRLVHLFTDAVIRTRATLAPHEARVHQAAMQELINRAGHEVADHHRHLIAQLIDGHGDEMHPAIRQYLQEAASGADQWKAISGLAMGGAQSALSTAISDAVAPLVYEIVSHAPNLAVGEQIAAAAAAAGIVSYDNARVAARKQGYNSPEFELMYRLAQQVPDLGTLVQLVNRGEMSEGDAKAWLRRAGLDPALHQRIIGLRHQLLTPADAALAVLRGEISEGQGRQIAAASGLDASRFDLLVANTGEPLGLEQLAEALRRGFINRQRFARGLRQSRVRNEWLDVAEALRFSPVPTADAVDAALRGHLDWAQARKIAEQNGIEPGEFGILEANAGSPPAPEQLLELHRRGAISSSRLDEGLRFGRLRNEWIPEIRKLEYGPVTVADAADAWLRGHLGEAQARKIMEENGLEASQVPIVLANAGNPLGLQQLLEAQRRGYIDRAQFLKGFRESRYREEWAGVAEKLSFGPPTTAEALGALVQGHVTEAEARDLAHQNGLEPKWFAAMAATYGSPLSRTELEQLYNRGKISRAVVVQGLRESRLKNKYLNDAFDLHVKLPEPRQVVTALTDGVITRAAAARILGDEGYAPETVAMLIATGEARSTGPHRQLMTGEISKLYADRIISRAEAGLLLEQLHFTAHSADLILRVADYTLHRRILDSGVAAVKAHYLAHRIDDAVAAGDLHALGLPADAADTYLKVWRLDRIPLFKTLTAAQIVKAHKLGLFTPGGQTGTDAGTQANDAEALRRLEALGYDATDAGLLLAGA